ncbi:GIY-YIG nuclease family protein [Shinella zoogloeoides]|uniref:GIY-YIG nuclease family protein n=1 Tax=Shinella zoogloeoides TaxID=352475 RepID=UPI001F57898F|nr:GIY-YIG nuclease family protein [Shinella zoogloeoides]
MTVYFIRKIESPSEIKIGTASNVAKRLATIARAVGPIHYFASMPGGVTTERKVQLRFAHLRLEGEWFRAGEDLETYIRLVADPESAEFRFKPSTWAPKAAQPIQRREHDARCALGLLRQIYERYPRQTPVGDCLEKAFQELHSMNVAWTRRRVRALHELRGLRVDVFEIVDMLTLLEIPRDEWADWISPKISQTRRAA